MSGAEWRAMREARGLSRAELAAATGISDEAIRRIEEHDVQPRARTARLLRRVLTEPQSSGDRDALARIAAAAVRLSDQRRRDAAAMLEAMVREGFEPADERGGQCHVFGGVHQRGPAFKAASRSGVPTSVHGPR